VAPREYTPALDNVMSWAGVFLFSKILIGGVKMKVLVTEKIDGRGIELMRKRGLQVDEKLNLERNELLSIIGNYEALIVRSATKVDRELLDSAAKMKVVGRAGNGMDNIDVKYAVEKNIQCINAPDSNSIAAAEHTIALLLAVCRNLPKGDSTLRDGLWERNRLMGVELYDKTVGIVGLGRIGKMVAARLQAFGMRTVAYDPFIPELDMARLNVKKVDTIDELMKICDFITVHMPKTKDTLGLIGEKELNLAKKDLRIVNCARGGLVDEDALYTALVEGRISGAGLDVFVDEPCTGNPLLTLDNVVATPHLGASTREAQVKAGIMTAEKIAAILTGEEEMTGTR